MHSLKHGILSCCAIDDIIAARVLATYLIPGCVGRGVRLGSENSSGGAGGAGAGGVWAQAWAQVGGPTWGPPTWWAHTGPKWVGPRGPKPEIWDPKKKKSKFSKSKSVLPKMSARFLLAGKRPSRPHLGPSWVIFCVGRKNPKNAAKIAYFPWWAHWPYSPALGNFSDPRTVVWALLLVAIVIYQ